MKRLFSLFLAAMFISGVLMVGKAQAFSFESGGTKFLADGYSYLDNDKLWGVFKVDSLKYWYPADNSFGSNYWNEGDSGDYLTVKFGGLDVDVFSSAATSGLGYFTGGWAELWYNNGDGVDPFVADALAGPGADYNRGDFGMNMTGGTLLLDLEFAEGGIWEHENASVAGVLPDTTAEHTFRVNALTGDPSTVGYAHVVGGSHADSFDSNYFFDLFDFFLEGSNQPTSYAGWNYQASSYSAYAVPEPGTMLLFGAGLLGLVGVRRRNMA